MPFFVFWGRARISRSCPRSAASVSTVFRSYGLFPHMTLPEDVICGLKFRGYKKAEARKKGMEYLDLAVQIAIMDQGVLVQDDFPMNLYRNPANDFVRAFLSLDQLVWMEDGTLMKVVKNGKR